MKRSPGNSEQTTARDLPRQPARRRSAVATGTGPSRGPAASDTGIISVVVGPRVVGSFGKISGEIAAKLPVLIDNTALQLASDYRPRWSIEFGF